MKTFTLAEVGQHNQETDCWIVIDGGVFDVTKFLRIHPGGKRIIMTVAGKDASEMFHAHHNDMLLPKYSRKLKIGELEGYKVAPMKGNGGFGNYMIPGAEPYWYNNDYISPYYTNSHREFRALVRNFVDSELSPFIAQWDESGGDYPMELHEKAYKAGILGANWPAEYGGTPPRGGFDAFHDLIFFDELARCGTGGLLTAIFFSFSIALPPVLNVGSKYLKDLVARDVITGKKIMSLAVTEPYAGSDVANLHTTARREGDFFIVSGEKKFISSASKAHYLTTAVRTGGKGHGGVSVLLIETNSPGITIRKQKTMGWWSSQTNLIIFDEVKVPVHHLIGELNKGFKPIMHNFNHERWSFSIMANRYSRICVEDAVKYARNRKVFGQRLIDSQVIRHKIANMMRQIDAAHAISEQLAFQMQQGVDDRKLGGPIALFKVQSTKLMEFCARESAQILGGASYLRTGWGQRIERIYREVRVSAIGAGSEEVMLDLGVRQANL